MADHENITTHKEAEIPLRFYPQRSRQKSDMGADERIFGGNFESNNTRLYYGNYGERI